MVKEEKEKKEENGLTKKKIKIKINLKSGI